MSSMLTSIMWRGLGCRSAEESEDGANCRRRDDELPREIRLVAVAADAGDVDGGDRERFIGAGVGQRLYRRVGVEDRVPRGTAGLVLS